MLRRFIYLDEKALNDYVGVLEDGLRDSRSTSTERRTDISGKVDAKVISGGREGSSATAEQIAATDTPPARFARLLRLAEADPEQSGWLDVATLDDLSEAGNGALVDFECEVSIPNISALTDADEMSEMFNLMSSFGGLAGAMGLDMEDMPSQREISEMKQMSGLLKSNDVVVLGEDDVSEWRMAGTLRRSDLRVGIDEFSDHFRVTGKVGRMIREGEYKPLLALPGMSLLPRDERRKLERMKPTDEDAEFFLRGPARMIDVLAIYR